MEKGFPIPQQRRLGIFHEFAGLVKGIANPFSSLPKRVCASAMCLTSCPNFTRRYYPRLRGAIARSIASLCRLDTSTAASLPVGYSIPQINTATSSSDFCLGPPWKALTTASERVRCFVGCGS